MNPILYAGRFQKGQNYTKCIVEYPAVTQHRRNLDVLFQNYYVRSGLTRLIYQNFVYYCMIRGTEYLVAVTDDTVKTHQIWQFLEEVSNKPDELEYLVKNWSLDFNKVTQIKIKIEDVKDIMIKNINSVVERGEKIELLVDKTHRLNQDAFKFNRSTRSLRRAMCRKNWKFRFLLASVVLILIGLLIGLMCIQGVC